MVLQYREEARFKRVSARELKRVCKDALDELGWRFEVEDRWRIIAYVPYSFTSYGEWLIVDVFDEELVVISHCRRRLQLVDWGKNRRNVDRFLNRVEDILDDDRR
jgi:hypothetical protein